MHRLRWMFLGIAAAAVPFGLGAGVGGSPRWLLGIVLLWIGVLLTAAASGRFARATPGGWTPSGGFVYERAEHRPPSPPRRIALALGRSEARQLLPGSLAFGVGIGFCLLVILTLGIIWARDHGGETATLAELFPIVVHPLAGMTVVAAFRARTRSRRDGVEEVFAACPVDQRTRTLGHLASAWMPALTTLVFAIAYFGAYLASTDVHWGGFGSRQVANVVAGALLPVGAVALGVALARVAPWSPVPIVAVVGVGIASIQLATSGDGAFAPSRQLSTWLTDPEIPIRYTHVPWVLHHLWILGLVAVVTLLAVLIDTPDRRRLGGVLAASALATGAFGYLATRPLATDDARALAALISGTDGRQVCLGSGVPVCVDRADQTLGRRFAADIRPVVAALPAAAVPPVELRQGGDLELRRLDPAVAALVDPNFQAAALPLEILDHPEARDGARFWVALAAVGAVGPQSRVGQSGLAGQARGVVAIWLATRGLDPEHARRFASTKSGTDRPWPGTCYAGPPPVVWALTDLDAAQRVLAVPDREVRALVREQWAILTDPATSTDALLALLHLDPVGAPIGRTVTTEC